MFSLEYYLPSCRQSNSSSLPSAKGLSKSSSDSRALRIFSTDQLWFYEICQIIYKHNCNAIVWFYEICQIIYKHNCNAIVWFYEICQIIYKHNCNAIVRFYEICQMAGWKNSKTAPELSPWYYIEIDFVDAINITPASYQGSYCIFTMSDYFSKFVQAIAMESKHTSNVAAAHFGEI